MTDWHAVGWLLQNAVFVAGTAVALFWLIMIPLGAAAGIVSLWRRRRH